MGMVLYYPVGSTRSEDGKEKRNRDIAKEMLTALREGKSITLPVITDEHGNLKWRLDRGCKVCGGLPTVEV